MPKFRKKPVVIEATQWFKNGDHPEDGGGEVEGKIVRYYRHPEDDGQRKCDHCARIMHDHGWIDTLEGGHNVCPGDWIINGVQGERYPCKPEIFAATYEPASSPEGVVLADHELAKAAEAFILSVKRLHMPLWDSVGNKDQMHDARDELEAKIAAALQSQPEGAVLEGVSSRGEETGTIVGTGFQLQHIHGGVPVGPVRIAITPIDQEAESDE